MKNAKTVSAAVLLMLCGCAAPVPDTPVPSAEAQPAETPSPEPEASPEVIAVFEAADMTVSAYSTQITDTYDGVSAGEGKRFMIIPVRTENTSSVPVMVYDTDFLLCPESDGDACSFPLTGAMQDRFPEVCEIAPGMEKTGRLIFLVPEGAGAFTFSLNDDDEVYSLTIEGE